MMMSSQVATPGVGVPQAGPQSGAQIQASHLHGRFPTSSPSSASSSPAQMAFEGRLSLMTNQPPYPHQQYPSSYSQSPYTANLNFNLINNAFKPKDSEATPNIDIPFNLNEGNLSPSSASGSPRTDETLDKTSDNIESSHDISHDISHESEALTGLEIMRQQIQQIPEQISRPLGITVRQDIQQEVSEEVEENHSVEENQTVHEIHDVEDNDEELLIDEEMEEREVNNDSIERHEETFEEVPVEKLDNIKQFTGYQPYLNMKEGGEGINSLEKLQQVLNNRIFDNTEGKTTSIVTNGNAVNGNLKVEGEGEFKFILPADEDGLVYQCHLCSFTGTTRFNFNAHVNTHYEFQCLKCDFEDKSEATYVRHLKEEHNCTPEDLEEAEVRVPRVNSQGKVKTFKCKQCEFVAVTKLEFWKHGRGHIKPEKLLFCPKCIFVTEYKHHLEYHLRNHYGTKPFKCTHCNYSCVNKSMLNSHMKSHTNVYQYRCADCTYATKYCHSLKLHLKKYAHKPAMVLNNDGSPHPLPAVDVFGNRRGPKNNKGGREEQEMFPSLLPQFPPNFPPNFPSNFPSNFMAQMQLHHLQNQFGNHPKIAQVPPFRLEDPIKKEERGVSPPMMDEPENLRCEKCEFSTTSSEVYKNHVLLHASSERGALHRLLTSPLQPNKARHDQNISSDDLNFSPKSMMGSPSSPRSPFPQKTLFMDRPESPTSSTGNFQAYFNKIAIANPLLQGLVPNPAIKALMEERKREGSLPSSPDSFRNYSPHSREEAPLPPNKRLKTDIFASLYANKMSELAEKGESPSGVLDLSKECNDTIIGGGSHGSSSDNESGSNPRSHSSSPSLSSSTTKNRRKGKAFKIERRFDQDTHDTNSEEEISTVMPSLMPINRSSSQLQDNFSELTTCKYCGISFKNSAMHSIHMGYHGCREPFKCNLCGDESHDALSFFLHIARKEHR